MKKTNFIFLLILFSGNLLFAQAWDILEKSMTTWNTAGESPTNAAWSILQNNQSGVVITKQTDYVNILKTNASTTTSRYAFLISPTLNLLGSTSYSVEIKARVNAIDKIVFPDVSSTFEANQISLRLNNKNAPIFLKYGNTDNGYICTTAAATHTDENKYKINTSEWHIYRFVFHADNSKYDVYIDEIKEPIFENVETVSKTAKNMICLGAESYHRCNMDIEYVKMGAGDFYSKPKIISVSMNTVSQVENTEKTITIIANTVAISDGEKMQISLVDGEYNTIVDVVETVVFQNKAEANLTIPATVAKGKYLVKVAVPNGKIGDAIISPKTAAYFVSTSAYTGKNLVVFGNSITAATNSWAYQTYEKLNFGDLYNGAFAGACWYKRARLAQDGDSIWTQDYIDPNFAGMSNGTNTDRTQFQKIINNCAVVHIQKYIADNPNASPDYAILSYGTNDVASLTMGSVEDTMSKDFDKINLFTMAGALRWSIETLKKKFPNLVIYVALPIQAKSASKNSDNLRKIKVITGICDALSITYFDCYNESGITVENEATYLRDGLHPNAAGQAVHGDYIIKKLEEEANLSSEVIQNKAYEQNIFVSASVVGTGQILSIKSPKGNAPLAEISFYNIAGNRVYHESVSGCKHLFQAPYLSGAYVLNVRLANNTSKGFKILVK